MNKRHALLLTAVLGMATAYAQTAPTTTTVNTLQTVYRDPSLTSAPITANVGKYVGPLSTFLASIAKSAGYEVVFNFNIDALALINGEIVFGNSTASVTTSYATPLGRPQELPAKPVVHNFSNAPFNEAWPLLMDVYELDYQLVKVGSANVIRIGQRPKQLALPLKFISAESALTAIEKFFGEEKFETVISLDSNNKPFQTTRPTGKFGLPNSIKVIPDSSNKRLIIGSNSEDGIRIRSFVETIDVQSSGKVISTDSISEIYIVRGQKESVLQFLRDSFPELIVTDYASGGLAIEGPRTSVNRAIILLGQVDRAPEIPIVQRIYTVRGQAADITALLAAQYPTLRVTPVGQTGQLVLNGAQAQLDTALALLEQVDRPAPVAESRTVQRVFQLVNASAEEVKATLEGTLARDLTADSNNDVLPNVPVTATDANGNTTVVSVPNALGKTANQGTANAQAQTAQTPANTQQATLIAYKRTNSLIVRGTPEQVAQVAELVPQLDQVVPQINVQVRIQEVNERALQSLGLNWRATFGGFNVAVSGGTGLAATFNPTQSFLGFNIFPTLTALETQGLTRRVYDGNVTMQSGQRSLSATGGAQNASSGAAASVKSGGRLEINIPSAAGNIVRQIDYGLNLDFFSPQVAPDGTITLRIRGQVNQPATAITADSLPNLIDFTNSEAQSTITFKNGQTILMSGLLGSTETTNRSGVPFLSSLPGVGAAFGEKRTEKTQSQLLVIITGTVVK